MSWLNEEIDVEKLRLIISPSDVSVGRGPTICGPTCIESPPWVDNQDGKFYLYFCHHDGKQIYRASSDDVEGPWVVSPVPALVLDDFQDAYDHIASPDIRVDYRSENVILYFHARARSRGREQWTFAALSRDGKIFERYIDTPIAPFYLRTFEFGSSLLGLSKGGNLLVKGHDSINFQMLGNLFDEKFDGELWHNHAGAIRHVSIKLQDQVLTVFYSRIGDAPECIYRTRFSLSGQSINEWRRSASFEEVLIIPERDYEGSRLPLVPSQSGPSEAPENALRDPYYFKTGGIEYLFYTVAGESGIAVAKLVPGC